MRCYMCGSTMVSITTTLPFKINQTTVVIVKNLPVSQCSGCREYVLDDVIMERVEDILQHVDETAELEVLKYAA
jgi:YgiT-type zinc finger domain-containing protein